MTTTSRYFHQVNVQQDVCSKASKHGCANSLFSKPTMLKVKQGKAKQINSLNFASIKVEKLRKQRQDYIRLWWHYFSFAKSCSGVHILSGWIRRHIGEYFLLRWHMPRALLRAIRSRHTRKSAWRSEMKGSEWTTRRHAPCTDEERLTRSRWYLPWSLRANRRNPANSTRS